MKISYKLRVLRKLLIANGKFPSMGIAKHDHRLKGMGEFNTRKAGFYIICRSRMQVNFRDGREGWKYIYGEKYPYFSLWKSLGKLCYKKNTSTQTSYGHFILFFLTQMTNTEVLRVCVYVCVCIPLHYTCWKYTFRGLQTKEYGPERQG